MRFWDAVSTMDVNGHQALAAAAIRYYDDTVQGMNATDRVNVACMFDEVLTDELHSQAPIQAEDVILSPDFAFMRAMARQLQGLGLDDLSVEITLTEEDEAHE